LANGFAEIALEYDFYGLHVTHNRFGDALCQCTFLAQHLEAPMRTECRGEPKAVPACLMEIGRG